MGYTHYFNVKKANTLNESALNNLKSEVDAVFKAHKKTIQYEYNNGKPAECEIIQDEANNKPVIFIRFNGKGDGGHETFVFVGNDTDFNFCKTARKPYDIVACKVLILLYAYFGEDLKLDSDGFSSYQPDDRKYLIGDFVHSVDADGEWANALKWYNETHEDKLVFVVAGVHGDRGQYFSYTIEKA